MHLIITSKRKKNNNDWKNGLSISFAVYVPENIASNLSTSGGNISISALPANRYSPQVAGTWCVKN